MSGRTVKVYEVLHDGSGEGAAGDGTHVARFRALADAERFASTATLYGRPAPRPHLYEAPRRLAVRWGMA